MDHKEPTGGGFDLAELIGDPVQRIAAGYQSALESKRALRKSSFISDYDYRVTSAARSSGEELSRALDRQTDPFLERGASEVDIRNNKARAEFLERYGFTLSKDVPHAISNVLWQKVGPQIYFSPFPIEGVKGKLYIARVANPDFTEMKEMVGYASTLDSFKVMVSQVPLAA